MIWRRVFYEGRVQGVGFRYAVKQIATGFDVAGSVKNLDDGRVRLDAGGDSSEVQAFLEAIRNSELGSLIRQSDESEIAPPAATQGFHITL